MIRLEVIGAAKAQGNAKAFMAGGKARIAAPRGAVRDWRASVAEAALEDAKHRAAAGAAGVRFPDGPLAVAVVYRQAMRKTDRRQGGKGGPKTGSPLLVATAPDRDKLDRAIGDALTAAGVVWTDDAQSAIGMSAKVYVVPGAWTGAIVLVGAEAEARAVIDAGLDEVELAREHLRLAIAAADAAPRAAAKARSRAGKKGRGVDAVLGDPAPALALDMRPPDVATGARPGAEDFG